MAQSQLGKKFHSLCSIDSPTDETPDSFNYETKFVVLNFLSRSPNDVPYRNTFSPCTSTSESEYRGHCVGSKSLPSSPPKHRQHHRLGSHNINNNNEIKNFKTQRVSEDNIHYKYHKFKNSLEDKLEIDGEGSFESSLDTSKELLKKHRKSDHDVYKHHLMKSEYKNRESMTLAQFRQVSMSRTTSSMSCDYSADDEGDDTSCGSSLNDSASNVQGEGRQGGIDFLQVVSRLPTVKSESEMENEIPGLGDSGSNVLSNNNENISDLGCEDTDLKSDSNDNTFEEDPALSTSLSFTSGTEHATGSKSLDRSKLKLDIQEHHSFENSGKSEKWEAIAASLRAELEDEMTSLESEVEEAIKKNVLPPTTLSPFLTPLSPQSEAARFLARIGDDLQNEYRDQLDLCVRRLVLNRQVTYEDFKSIAKDVIDKSMPGWRQVVLLMLYGQKALWKALETGQNKISDIVEYTTRLVADLTAEFIISQGGWGAVMNSDPSLSSESPATNASESPKDAHPLGECHWSDSPKGDGDMTDKLCHTVVDSPMSCCSSDTVEAEAVNSDNVLGTSLPVIHATTTSPVPKEAWRDKEIVPEDLGESLSHSKSEETIVNSVESNEADENSNAAMDEMVNSQDLLAEDNLSDSSSDIENRVSHPWYRMILVPEHLVLLSCIVVSIGLGAFLSSHRRG